MPDTLGGRTAFLLCLTDMFLLLSWHQLDFLFPPEYFTARFWSSNIVARSCPSNSTSASILKYLPLAIRWRCIVLAFLSRE